MSFKKWSQYLIRRPHIGWVVWIFPAIALVLSVWVFVKFAKDRGPLIEIRFPEAAGIEAAKTPIRFRGIDVGRVEDISLSEDSKDVVIYVRLVRQAKQLAVNGTKFWIVQPKVSFQGVSGLETLFQGPYINMRPGNKESKFKDKFVGTVGPDDDSGMVSYFLRTAHSEPLSPGDSVSFRGMRIGSVAESKMQKTGQAVDVKINIERKFVKLVRNNTIFWKKKGVSAKLGLFGSKVEIGSLDTLMRGGVELATPAPAAKIANAQETFELREEAPKEFEKWSPDLSFNNRGIP